MLDCIGPALPVSVQQRSYLSVIFNIVRRQSLFHQHLGLVCLG